jgi:probable phosphoglycerate mutase
VTPAGSSVGAYLVVRHGETEWSSSGRHTGRTDLALTEAGKVEAMSAGALLATELGFDEPVAVFTSPLVRARETARLALRSVSVGAPEPVVTPDLAEVDYGKFEGLTSSEIAVQSPHWDLWRDGCPGGETPDDVVARVDAFVALAEDAVQHQPGGTVVAFTHGHLSRALVSVLLDLPLQAAGVLINDTASVAVVRRRRGQLTLAGWNLRPQAAAPRPH